MIKRYRLGIKYNWDEDSCIAVITEDKEGEYIKYDDHIKILTEIEKKYNILPGILPEL